MDREAKPLALEGRIERTHSDDSLLRRSFCGVWPFATPTVHYALSVSIVELGSMTPWRFNRSSFHQCSTSQTRCVYDRVRDSIFDCSTTDNRCNRLGGLGLDRRDRCLVAYRRRWHPDTRWDRCRRCATNQTTYSWSDLRTRDACSARCVGVVCWSVVSERDASLLSTMVEIHSTGTPRQIGHAGTLTHVVIVGGQMVQAMSTSIAGRTSTTAARRIRTTRPAPSLSPIRAQITYAASPATCQHSGISVAVEALTGEGAQSADSQLRPERSRHYPIGGLTSSIRRFVCDEGHLVSLGFQ